MKHFLIVLILIITSSCFAGEDDKIEQRTIGNSEMKFNKLTEEEHRIIVEKGTERRDSGKYLHNKAKGVYTCKRCNAYLYLSKDKFDSSCGWPSFDDEIKDAILRKVDADGRRTEILCKRCNGHLGHVFKGENFTKKNTRHCVNSLSMIFLPEEKVSKAIFAAGCFWGVEYLMKQQKGVIATKVGYIGGHTVNPTYKDICNKDTGHREAIEIIYDPLVVSYESLAKLFFEIHDPSQKDGQGPDIGEQYLSEIYYMNDEQKETALKLIDILKKKNIDVATKVTKSSKFYDAEEYHQDYYTKNGKKPYCHTYKKKFD